MDHSGDPSFAPSANLDRRDFCRFIGLGVAAGSAVSATTGSAIAGVLDVTLPPNPISLAQWSFTVRSSVGDSILFDSRK